MFSQTCCKVSIILIVKKLYQLFHLLQLDIALGAVAISIWFSRLENIGYDLMIPILLGMAVWIIYTSDHILDAYRYRKEIKGGRYEFFYRNWKILSIICIALAIPAGFLTINLSPDIWKVGLSLSGIVLLYLILAHFARSKFYLLKELFVAIIYAGGVLIANIAIQGFWEVTLPLFWVFAIVLCDLLMYSILELADDAKMNMPSLTKQLGLKQIRLLHDIFLCSAFMTWLLLSYRYEFDWFWILPSSVILIMLLQFRIKGIHFYKNGTHRYYGELIFMIPWIALLLDFLLTAI